MNELLCDFIAILLKKTLVNISNLIHEGHFLSRFIHACTSILLLNLMIILIIIEMQLEFYLLHLNKKKFVYGAWNKEKSRQYSWHLLVLPYMLMRCKINIWKKLERGDKRVIETINSLIPNTWISHKLMYHIPVHNEVKESVLDNDISINL